MSGGAQKSSLEHVGSDMAKAFQEISKGEKTASALESRLTDIEGRIDQLLASIEETDTNEHHSPADKPAGREAGRPSRK